MLKIRVLGKGLIPRGYGLAPRLSPFMADLTLLGTILSTPGLTVEYFNNSTGKFETLHRKNLRVVYEASEHPVPVVEKIVEPAAQPTSPPVVPPTNITNANINNKPVDKDTTKEENKYSDKTEPKEDIKTENTIEQKDHNSNNKDNFKPMNQDKKK